MSDENLNNQLGKGLVPHSEEDTGIKLALAAPVTFDWTNLKTKNALVPGINQGSSSSCTAQAFKMAVKRSLGLDISVEYIYSHIFLPGGGAFLVAPAQFTNDSGYVLTSKYPDPNPETEQAMEFKMTVPDGDTLRTFKVTAVVSSTDTIDAVASAIMNHDAAILGIWYTDQGFSKSLMYPSYDPAYSGREGHALLASNPIIHNGLHAIDCDTSWFGTMRQEGPCTHHVLDENFFAKGGVFELLTLDFQEITSNETMKLVNDKGTVYLITGNKDKRKIGIADLTSLGLFGDEPQTPMDTTGIPEYNVIKDGKTITHK